MLSQLNMLLVLGTQYTWWGFVRFQPSSQDPQQKSSSHDWPSHNLPISPLSEGSKPKQTLSRLRRRSHTEKQSCARKRGMGNTPPDGAQSRDHPPLPTSAGLPFLCYCLETSPLLSQSHYFPSIQVLKIHFFHYWFEIPHSLKYYKVLLIIGCKMLHLLRAGDAAIHLVTHTHFQRT